MRVGMWSLFGALLFAPTVRAFGGLAYLRKPTDAQGTLVDGDANGQSPLTNSYNMPVWGLGGRGPRTRGAGGRGALLKY